MQAVNADEIECAAAGIRCLHSSHVEMAGDGCWMRHEIRSFREKSKDG